MTITPRNKILAKIRKIISKCQQQQQPKPQQQTLLSLSFRTYVIFQIKSGICHAYRRFYKKLWNMNNLLLVFYGI